MNPWIIVLLVIALGASASIMCPEGLSEDCVCHSSNQIHIKCNFTSLNPPKITNDTGRRHNITLLDLSNNNLSSLSDFIFSGIYSIRELDLSGNILDSISSVSNLQFANQIVHLNISHNKLTQMDDSMFSTMPALEKLDVSNNMISSVGDNTFVNSRQLWYLNLANNFIGSLSAATFNGIEASLVYLDLSTNRFSTVSDETFSSLHDLKYLKLSDNENTSGLSNIKFPVHMILLDLKNSGIGYFDDCRLLTMVDLEHVNLENNPLKCSCHLSWFLEQLTHRQKTNSIFNHHEINNNWTCTADDTTIIKVTDFKAQCSDHLSMEPPEHCQKSSQQTSNSNVKTQLGQNLNLVAEKGDNEVSLTWQRYNSSDFYGYEIVIFGEKGELVYSSPKLHPSVSEYTAKSEELKNGKYQVCLNVLHNETHVLGKACNEISYLNLQIVVGILAGVIFLIPCIIALTYIMCLDKRKFMFDDTYSEVPAAENDLEKQINSKEDSLTKQSTAKWKKDTLKIPTIKVQDLSTTGESKHRKLTEARSTDRILPDNDSSSNASIEPDGDSGSSAGIRIDIPSDNDDQGSINQAYIEEKTCDVKL